MLKFYLVTVIIWMIIIYCVAALFKDEIAKKLGSTTAKASLFKQLKTLFILSAVPILRLIFVATMVYVVVCTQEDLDKLMEKTKKDRAE